MTLHPIRRGPAAALAAAVAALATAGVLAGPGAAHPAARTLHLTSTADPSVGFGLSGKPPHEGSRFGFGANVSGDDTGTVRLVCTVVGEAASVCTAQLQLAHGTISAQGAVPEVSDHTPMAITGGTGAYDGASGTALVTDTSPTTSEVVITLRR
jgi:hypothetical protein